MYTDYERLIYTAGFIEADGNFTVGTRTGGTTIRITNKHIPTLQRFAEWFGGGVRSKGSPANCYEWTLHSKDAALLADNLIPFLFMKREEAELVVLYYNTIQPRGKKVSKEIWDIRDKLAARMKEIRATRNKDNA